MSSNNDARDRKPTRRDLLKRTAVIGLAAIGVGAVSCSDDETPAPATPATTAHSGHTVTGTSVASATPPAAPGVHEIRAGGPAGGLVFEPDRLQINRGERIRWVVASAGHSTTAYHPDSNASYESRIPDAAAPWDSGILFNPGDSFEHVFDIEGVYNYYCIPHEGAGMVGAIVVGTAGAGPGTAPIQPDLSVAARNKLEELRAWSTSLSG